MAGGCVSLIVITITLLFGIVKLEQMVTRNSPTINEYLLEDEITSDDNLDLGDESIDIAMAFGLVDG